MGSIAGIMHPSAFQMSELMSHISNSFLGANDQKAFNTFRYKNLELGIWEVSIASNQKKTIWALLDGDVLNASEISKELKEEPSLHSQAELVVKAYEAWNEQFLRKLHGPFALVLFDEEKETLFLARDRIGQKSLYWTTQSGYFLFSSQIKGLLSTGLVPQTPSIEALASYFYFGFIPQDMTVIKKVNKLLPGHYLKINLNRKIFIGQYWSYSRLLEAKAELTAQETFEELGHLLVKVLPASIPEHENFCSELNGNLGSFILNGFLAHLVNKDRFKVYTSYFEHPQSQEPGVSGAFAQQFGLDWEGKKITVQQVLENLVEIIWHLDEPVADFSCIRGWYLGKLAAKNGRVLITDCGWEEMFAGHSRYFSLEKKLQPTPSLAYKVAHLPSFLRKSILSLLSFIHPKSKFRILRNIDINRELMDYLLRIALFKGKNRKKVSPFLYPLFDYEIFTQRFHRLTAVGGMLEPALYFDVKTELPDRLLFHYERLFSPHGAELSAPYLDLRLVEFLAHVPGRIKFGEENVPASMLQNIMNNLSPSCPPYREPKNHYLHTWSQNHDLRQIFSLLGKGRLVEEGLVSEKWIQKKLRYKQLIPRSFNHLWALLVLEIWFRLYINRPLGSQNPKVGVKEFLET